LPSDQLVINVGAPVNPGSEPQYKPTAAMPYIAASEMHYYYCPRLNANMIRADGFVVAFLAGIHETDNFSTINWLENEIANRHPELFKATPEQIDVYLFKKDPVNHIKHKAKDEIEAELTDKLAKLLGERLAGTELAEALTGDTLREMLAAEMVPVIESPAPQNLSVQEKLAALRGNGVTLKGMANTGNLPT